MSADPSRPIAPDNDAQPLSSVNAKVTKDSAKPRAAPKAKAPAKKKAEPLSQRKSNEADIDLDRDRTPDVNGALRTPGVEIAEASASSSSRTTPAPGTKKSATETYQKVRETVCFFQIYDSHYIP